MKAVPIRFILLALLLEMLFAAALHAGSTDRIATAIVLLLIAGAVYVVAVYEAHQFSTTGTGPLFTFIIASAIVFRFTILPLAYPSTDDAYRYRWEGKLQAYGGNPYQVRPADPEWAFLRDSTFDRVGLKNFKGGYGPAWEMISAATYRAASVVVRDERAQVFWFKLPAVLADLGIMAALVALLRLSALPRVRVATYAWCPLPIWEFWANGHNDAPVVLAIILGLVWLLKRKPAFASLALAIAIALKFWPAILVPAFTRSGVRVRHWLAVLPLLCLFAIPYWSSVWENARFMSGFVGGWRNFDSLFGGILWIMGDLYRAKYAAFALIAGWAIFIAWKIDNVVRASLWTIVGMLLVASNCHPWYLTWFLPLLAVELVSGLLLWVALVFLSYSIWPGWVATGIWDGTTPIRWFIYLPVAVVLSGRFLYDRWDSTSTRTRQGSI